MSKDEEKWIKNKAGLIVELMRMKFEERMYDAFETMDFKSIEELDAWVDIELRKFEDEKRAVKAYYNKLIDRALTEF